MNFSQNFQYDEISIFTEHETKYGIPLWKCSTDLNKNVDSEKILTDIGYSFNEWAKTQKFPLLCSFNLPDGIYSAYLFKLCRGPENIFELDISHFEYKGKNPNLVFMKLPVEDCPFDEMLPVPGNRTAAISEADQALKSGSTHRRFLTDGYINEAGMRKHNFRQLKDFPFYFPKYLYN